MYDNVKFTSQRIHAEPTQVAGNSSDSNQWKERKLFAMDEGLEVFLERGPAQFETVCTEHLVIYKSARHGGENSDLFMIDIICLMTSVSSRLKLISILMFEQYIELLQFVISDF